MAGFKAILLRPPDPMGMVDILSHTEPTNLGYLAAYSIQAGIDVDIWDYEQNAFIAKEFLEKVREVQPAVIGMSCMTPTIMNGHIIATLIKKHFPNIFVVVGGAHSSAIPVQTLEEFPHFDLVVNQEGESSFLEVLQHLKAGDKPSKIQGTTWRDGEDIVREESRGFIKELDDIPFPARQLYHDRNTLAGHSSRGFSNTMKSTEIFTSRGCPYKCSFCAIVATFNRSLRFRSIENVEAEVVEVKKNYGTDHVVIADDTFGLKSGLLEALCDVFTKHKISSWNCDTRVDAVDPESLRMMHKSGCTKVAFGVESGSPRLIALNEKKITPERVIAAVREAHEAGIKHIEANFIVGSHPDETYDDLMQTAALIRQLPISFISVSITVPYPGTPNFEYMKERNLIETYDWSKYVMFGKAPRWRTVHFTSDDLLAYQKKLNRSFYLNPKYMLRMLGSIRSFSELRYYAKSGVAFVKWLTGVDLAPDHLSKMDTSDEGFVAK